MRAPSGRRAARILRRLAPVLLAGCAIAAAAGAAAAAEDSGGFRLSDVLPAGEAAASGRIVQMVVLLTVLSLAPGILVMVTSFTRFVIAFSFLRSAMGLPSTPSNVILISLSLFMTNFVMQPTLTAAWNDGLKPLIANEIDEETAFVRIAAPFRTFMLDNVRDKDLALFADLQASVAAPPAGSSARPPEDAGKAVEEPGLTVLVPAFMVSELRRGFEIGFLIALPFLVIDVIVATVVMSMGMMMMPPAMVALPFKVLFFVLIDGWNILVGGLVRSYGG